MKKTIELEDALRAITKRLDEINGTPAGSMYGVAKVWLKDVSVIEIPENES